MGAEMKLENKAFSAIFLILYAGIFLRHILFSINLELTLFADIAVFVVIPIAVLIFVYALFRTNFIEMAAELKWSWAGLIISLLLGIACANIIDPCIKWIEYWLNYYAIRQTDISQLVIIRYDVVGIFYLAITAGLFEEWLFKSVLIRSFRKVPSQIVFVTVSTTLFAAAHYWQGPIAMIIFALLFALPTSVYYYRTRNILNLVIIHVVSDFLIFGAAWAQESKLMCMKIGC